MAIVLIANAFPVDGRTSPSCSFLRVALLRIFSHAATTILHFSALAGGLLGAWAVAVADALRMFLGNTRNLFNGISSNTSPFLESCW